MKNSNKINFDALKQISTVVEKIKNSKLKVKRTQAFTTAEKRLCEYFGTSKEATWMLCAIISYYFEHNGNDCDFDDLSDFFNCPVMSIMEYKSDIDSLLSKKYVRNTESAIDDQIGLKNEFEVSTELISAILNNEKICITNDSSKKQDIFAMLAKAGSVVEGRDTRYEKRRQIQWLEKKFANESFITETFVLLSDDLEARMFFYDACYDCVIMNRESGLDCTIRDVYGSQNRFAVAKAFMDERHPLLKNDLLELTNKETLTEARVTLTQKAKEMLLGEDAKLYEKATNGTNVIQPQKIVAKELFYSDQIQGEIERLTESLQEKNLKTIQKRMAQKGLPKGIAVLLYGAPGTGKTESVYQIAKKTGRRILHVDISAAKSCWFGESEKLVKKIFTDYKSLCKAAKAEKGGKMPILLFNEADGILSKRKDASVGNLSQTENAIQNIILEEMEKLEGIMVATTNLADNLDAAFERRFLFKIKFENPTVDTKRKIWKSKLEWLDQKALDVFAQSYDLSGGQIDNIVRKVTMDEVLTGRRPSFDELQALCKNERLNNADRRIGFTG